MSKKVFLVKLIIKLSNLPKDDLEERINFYSEMIDDRIEDGFSEEDAINDIGTLDEASGKCIITNSKTEVDEAMRDAVKYREYGINDNSIIIKADLLAWQGILVYFKNV